MKQVLFKSPSVAAVFDTYSPTIKAKLLLLRQLIFETAAQTNGVGEVDEMLKWGQPSYLTTKTKSGSTIRIDRVKAQPGQYAMYFHCQTSLIETFRKQYPKEFNYQGNRSIVFDINQSIPTKKLSHCIELALTYHLRKRDKHK